MYNNENADNFRANKPHVNHLDRILGRRQKSYIRVLLAVILLLSIVAATNVIAESVADDNYWLASQYKMPNALESEQVAVYGDTTVRLLYVIPSSSETLVELEIEDPLIGTGPNDETFAPLQPSISLDLVGFTTNDIFGQPKVQVVPGKQRIVLDLPPLCDFNTMATIELKNLQKFNFSTGTLTSVEGLWQLSFTPNVQPEQMFSRYFNMDKQEQVGDVQILLQGGQISATETLVYYQVVDERGVTTESVGRPTLEYPGQVSRERSRYSIDGNHVLSFPPIPANINQFTVTFPRMISLDGPGALVSIPVGDYLGKSFTEDGSISMDEVVEVNASRFRFTKLVTSDNYFSLYYQPADKAQDIGLLLAGLGPLPLSDIGEATDDQGNFYDIVGAGTTFDKKDNFKLKQQRIDFKGNLDPQAGVFTIKVKTTGVMGEPFVFEVTTTQ